MKLPVAITQTAARQALLVQKNSPTLLFGAGLVGFVATTVLASKATLKASEVVSEAKHNVEIAKSVRASEEYADKYSEDDYKRDVATVYLQTSAELIKLYGPAIVAGGLTVLCLTKSHNILTKRNAGLTAAYAAIDKAFKAYRKRVEDEYGEDKELAIYRGETKSRYSDEIADPKTKAPKNDRGLSEYARVFDQLNRNWNPEPTYNQVFLRATQNWANDLLRARGHVLLNDVYDALGFERTEAGAVVGWALGKGGNDYIDFGIYEADTQGKRDFINGYEHSIWLDFNVDGVVYDKITRYI